LTNCQHLAKVKKGGYKENFWQREKYLFAGTLKDGKKRPNVSTKKNMEISCNDATNAS
jgi:hypothetical protein